MEQYVMKNCNTLSDTRPVRASKVRFIERFLKCDSTPNDWINQNSGVDYSKHSDSKSPDMQSHPYFYENDENSRFQISSPNCLSACNEIHSPSQTASPTKPSIAYPRTPEGEDWATMARQMPPVRGVCFDFRYKQWCYKWKHNNKQCKRSFAALKYGFLHARELALQCKRDTEGDASVDCYLHPESSTYSIQSPPKTTARDSSYGFDSDALSLTPHSADMEPSSPFEMPASHSLRPPSPGDPKQQYYSGSNIQQGMISQQLNILDQMQRSVSRVRSNYMSPSLTPDYTSKTAPKKFKTKTHSKSVYIPNEKIASMKSNRGYSPCEEMYDRKNSFRNEKPIFPESERNFLLPCTTSTALQEAFLEGGSTHDFKTSLSELLTPFLDDENSPPKSLPEFTREANANRRKSDSKNDNSDSYQQTLKYVFDSMQNNSDISDRKSESDSDRRPRKKTEVTVSESDLQLISKFIENTDMLDRLQDFDCDSIMNTVATVATFPGNDNKSVKNETDDYYFVNKENILNVLRDLARLAEKMQDANDSLNGSTRNPSPREASNSTSPKQDTANPHTKLSDDTAGTITDEKVDNIAVKNEKDNTFELASASTFCCSENGNETDAKKLALTKNALCTDDEELVEACLNQLLCKGEVQLTDLVDWHTQRVSITRRVIELKPWGALFALCIANQKLPSVFPKSTQLLYFQGLLALQHSMQAL